MLPSFHKLIISKQKKKCIFIKILKYQNIKYNKNIKIFKILKYEKS